MSVNADDLSSAGKTNLLSSLSPPSREWKTSATSFSQKALLLTRFRKAMNRTLYAKRLVWLMNMSIAKEQQKVKT